VYLLVALLNRPPAGELLHGLLVPKLPSDGDGVRVLVAVLGTTISPYLLFWQSAHRIEDLRDEEIGGEDVVPLGRRRQPQARRKLRAARLDVVGGMLFSNVVMLAIMISTATTAGRRHLVDRAVRPGVRRHRAARDPRPGRLGGSRIRAVLMAGAAALALVS